MQAARLLGPLVEIARRAGTAMNRERRFSIMVLIALRLEITNPVPL